ncbi:hypothetical protein O1L55_31945 [Streptomyces albulus]|nr:hypothetical protein [Streptomyces noursei]
MTSSTRLSGLRKWTSTGSSAARTSTTAADRRSRRAGVWPATPAGRSNRAAAAPATSANPTT